MRQRSLTRIRGRDPTGWRGLIRQALPVIALALAVPEAEGAASFLWKVRIASSLTGPVVCTPSSVWVYAPRALEARAPADGRRLLRVRTQTAMRLCPLGTDSVLVCARGEKRVLILGGQPPRVIQREDLPSPVVDTGADGSAVVVITTHGVLVRDRGPWRRLRLPVGMGPGWTEAHLLARRGEATVMVSRRSGEVALADGQFRLLAHGVRGGIARAVAVGESVLLAGREGTVMLLDDSLRVVWEVALPGFLQGDPVLRGGVLWLACANRTLVGIDPRDGARRAVWQLNGPLSCPLAPFVDGVAWGTFDGKVWVASEDAPPDAAVRLARPAVGVAALGRVLFAAQEDGWLLAFQLDERPGGR